MKINIVKNHPINFYGFTVLPGMICGYDESNVPFVSNGNVNYNDLSVPIYFMRGMDEIGQYIWTRPVQVKRHNRQKFIDGIMNKALSRKKAYSRTEDGKDVYVNYMSSAQLESERWGYRETKNGSILHNGCKSNHYYFSASRI